MVQWSRAQLGPVPKVKRSGKMTLVDVIGRAGAAQITQSGQITFHALGDSGVNHAEDAERVAELMARDFKAGHEAHNPAFLFHLGDVVYGPSKDIHYGERFYRPYRHYPGKIIAIPGNHDGESISPSDRPSLKAFRANFCSAGRKVAPQAAGAGIYRQAMNQPGVYWFLQTPFVHIIGLYSNRLENPGVLEGDGGKDKSQLTWLKKQLQQLGSLKERPPLIIATHHPPYSTGGHDGSSQMNESIDALCTATEVWPDAFLSGHSHSYQRYTRRIGQREVPYLIAGTGGIRTQTIEPTGRATGMPGVSFDAALSAHGFLHVTASASGIQFEFRPIGDGGPSAPYDRFKLDLNSHRLLSI
jgi:predicted phosphodiesterase